MRSGAPPPLGDLEIKCLPVTLCLFLLGTVEAYEITDKFSLEALGTVVIQHGAYRYAFSDNGALINDTMRGSFSVAFLATFFPTLRDTLHARGSFAEGNGLNKLGGVSVAVNADDLEDDLKNINGRGRDNLLELWYKHTFNTGRKSSLGITLGIVDGTNYIDVNAFAHDHHFQFMNEVFVNRLRVPTYDPGAVIEFDTDSWHLRGLWMNTQNGPKEEGGTEFNYYAVEAGYTIDSYLGQGNYRLLFDITDSKFVNRNVPDKLARFKGFGISFDQQLGTTLGGFVRIGAVTDTPASIVFQQLYSGGLNINGSVWNSPQDELGMGYAYLKGVGDQPGDVDYTQVAELYVRFNLNGFSDMSIDLQYVKDRLRNAANPQVWVFGERFNVYF
jgi:hypothetical protein